MPRRDSGKAVDSIWWTRALPQQRDPLGPLLTAGPTGGLLVSLAGASLGSGSARLGLSQKGDLPSSGERVIFIWSKVAGAR